MKQESKLNSRQQEQAQPQTSAEQTQRSAAQEFATPEDLLRHDALHTPVPPTIAHRLAESISKETAQPQSWWRRLFGGSS
jgi:hypothetical protein